MVDRLRSRPLAKKLTSESRITVNILELGRDRGKLPSLQGARKGPNDWQGKLRRLAIGLRYSLALLYALQEKEVWAKDEVTGSNPVWGSKLR